MKLSSRISTITLCALMLWLVAGSALAGSDYNEYKQLRTQYDLGQPFSSVDKARFDVLHDRFMRDFGSGSLDERGGPDNYGYHWVDNTNGDTATYNWIELRGDASAVWPVFDNSDDAGVTVDLPFGFPFYGAYHNQMRINSNGLIEFTTSVGGWTNECLPSSNVPGPAIFAFWDDLDMSNGGNGENVNATIAYRLYPDYAVVEFCSTGHADFVAPPDDSYKFEIIIHANGRVKLQYANIVYDEYAETQTIGIQSSAAGPALEYVCDETGMQAGSGLAVWFYLDAVGYLSGTVTNEIGAPLANVAVSLIGTEVFAHTDGSGEFFMPTAPVGVYDVHCALLGYEPTVVSEVTITLGSPTVVEAELASLPTIVLPWSHAPLAIPDLDTVVAELNVTAAVDIEAVGVRINNLQHTYVDDLGLWLESPWGERILLSFRHGGTGDNYVNTQFDDLAVRMISDGNAPFPGRWLPESALAPLAGHSTPGVWKLYIYDHANQDVGSLVSWSLIFVGELSVHGTLAGQVTSDLTGEGIAEATVIVEDLGIFTFTNGTGNYELAVPAGTWGVKYSATGYCEQSVSDVVIENGITDDLDAVLDVSSGTPSVESLLEESTAGQITTTEFDFVNDGGCSVGWSAVATSSGWLSVEPDAGTVAFGESVTITVTYDATGMNAGQYTGEIVIASEGLNGTHALPVTLDLASAGEEVAATPPADFALRGNYPNPFNAATEIRYDVAQATYVSLVLYNLLGQEVRTLIDGLVEAGQHTIYWDGRDARGADLSTGLYIIQMKADGRAFTGKSMLIR